jgi:hypothetical protein
MPDLSVPTLLDYPHPSAIRGELGHEITDVSVLSYLEEAP